MRLYLEMSQEIGFYLHQIEFRVIHILNVQTSERCIDPLLARRLYSMACNHVFKTAFELLMNSSLWQ